MQLTNAGNDGDFGQIVNKEGRALGKVQTETMLAKVSRETGEAFSVHATGYDPDANDTLLMICNDHPTKDLVVSSIYLYCDTGSIVDIQLPTAKPTLAGTAITAQCLNRKLDTESSRILAYQDETGNTKGDIFDTRYLAANGDTVVDCQDAIRLGKDDCLGIDIVTAATMGRATILCYFEDPPASLK